MNYWLKIKIISHWNFFGNSKTYVYRNFKNKTVTINFGSGGRCTTYDYDGKWIVG
jgi:hypothetical protein